VFISRPNFDVLRMLPEITSLNLQPQYTLVYGYETPKVRQIVYDDPVLLPNTSRRSIGWGKDIYFLTFEAQEEHLTAAGLAKYGQAVNKLPLQYAHRALSCVQVKILPGPYPDAITHITVDLEDWISAIKSHQPDFSCVQERGELVQGAFRDKDAVVLAFDTWGQDSPPFPDGVNGVRISATTLLKQLEALQLQINLNDRLIQDEIKTLPMFWRSIASIFHKAPHRN
jgi:hypothetical protein